MTETFSPDQLADTGRKAYEQGDFEEASRAYQAAAEGFQTAGLPLKAAEMKNNQGVVLLQADQAESALEAVMGTPEVFEAAGELRLQAMALGNLAAALHALKQKEAAEEAYQAAADLFAKVDDPEMRASTLRSLSELQMRSGRQLEAVATMHTGLSGLKKPSLKERLVLKLLQTPFRFLDNQE